MAVFRETWQLARPQFIIGVAGDGDYSTGGMDKMEPKNLIYMIITLIAFYTEYRINKFPFRELKRLLYAFEDVLMNSIHFLFQASGERIHHRVCIGMLILMVAMTPPFYSI